jgi:hypothetical protein
MPHNALYGILRHYFATPFRHARPTYFRHVTPAPLSLRAILPFSLALFFYYYALLISALR